LRPYQSGLIVEFKALALPPFVRRELHDAATIIVRRNDGLGADDEAVAGEQRTGEQHGEDGGNEHDAGG
jgi:hypothetical protein